MCMRPLEFPFQRSLAEPQSPFFPPLEFIVKSSATLARRDVAHRAMLNPLRYGPAISAITEAANAEYHQNLSLHDLNSIIGRNKTFPFHGFPNASPAPTRTMWAHRSGCRESGQIGSEPAVSVLLCLPAIRHQREHDKLHDLTGDVLLITWDFPCCRAICLDLTLRRITCNL